MLHVSQIAEALGLEPARAGLPLRDARDAEAILDAWRVHIESLSWDTLLRPTPARGRSLRNLTVNVFHPFELMPGAWGTGRFDWRPEDDEVREVALGDRDLMARFTADAADGWRRFLDRSGKELSGHDPVVASPRGAVPFSALVSFQRWHASYHYRQLLAVVGGEARLLADLEDLSLPAEVF